MPPPLSILLTPVCDREFKRCVWEGDPLIR